jgi:hypothetical protein
MTCSQSNSSNLNSFASSTNCNGGCPDEFNCDGSCPDFQIKQHDTKPPFKVAISDCNGPIDLTGLVLEASMWANAKLKSAITSTDTYFALADGIGFQQALVGDIIVVSRVRNPEQMLITGFDENLKLVQVLRGYNGTPVGDYKKGTCLKIFRVLNSVAQTELTYEDQLQVDGTVSTNVLTKSQLVYEWLSNDTCVPGCFNFEFKLLKMTTSMSMVNSLSISTPSFTSFTPSEYGCFIGEGVEWVRRFPTDGSFVIKVQQSPTSESLT